MSWKYLYPGLVLALAACGKAPELPSSAKKTSADSSTLGSITFVMPQLPAPAPAAAPASATTSATAGTNVTNGATTPASSTAAALALDAAGTTSPAVAQSATATSPAVAQSATATSPTVAQSTTSAQTYSVKAHLENATDKSAQDVQLALVPGSLFTIPNVKFATYTLTASLLDPSGQVLFSAILNNVTVSNATPVSVPLSFQAVVPSVAQTPSVVPTVPPATPSTPAAGTGTPNTNTPTTPATQTGVTGKYSKLEFTITGSVGEQASECCLTTAVAAGTVDGHDPDALSIDLGNNIKVLQKDILTALASADGKAVFVVSSPNGIELGTLSSIVLERTGFYFETRPSGNAQKPFYKFELKVPTIKSVTIKGDDKVIFSGAGYIPLFKGQATMNLSNSPAQ